MIPDAVRDAMRALVATRWTSLTIVVTLALGTGLNCAVLALVYGILFRPLPYSHVEPLVLIDHEISFDRLDDWTSRLQTIESAGVFAPAPHVLRGIGPPHVVKAAFVSNNFLEVLGIQPVRGAVPGAGEAASGVFISERTARACWSVLSWRSPARLPRLSVRDAPTPRRWCAHPYGAGWPPAAA